MVSDVTRPLTLRSRGPARGGDEPGGGVARGARRMVSAMRRHARSADLSDMPVSDPFDA